MHALSLVFLMIIALTWVSASRAQSQAPDWQSQVRKYAEAKDWDSAMRVVERVIARAPQDMDVRAWRARVLAWAGKLPEAEKEYLEILRVARSDPDNWMGLANVYLREGKLSDVERGSAQQKNWIRNGLTFMQPGRGFCERKAKGRKRNRSFSMRCIWIREARKPGKAWLLCVPGRNMIYESARTTTC